MKMNVRKECPPLAQHCSNSR